MVNSTSFTVENMVEMMTSFSKTIEELEATITTLTDYITALQNENNLLKEENAILELSKLMDG